MTLNSVHCSNAQKVHTEQNLASQPHQRLPNHTTPSLLQPVGPLLRHHSRILQHRGYLITRLVFTSIMHCIKSWGGDWKIAEYRDIFVVAHCHTHTYTHTHTLAPCCFHHCYLQFPPPKASSTKMAHTYLQHADANAATSLYVSHIMSIISHT